MGGVQQKFQHKLLVQDAVSGKMAQRALCILIRFLQGYKPCQFHHKISCLLYTSIAEPEEHQERPSLFAFRLGMQHSEERLQARKQKRDQNINNQYGADGSNPPKRLP